ncbi:Lrp/AsnC family transcriptional regulator [Natrialba sp. INN-245]|uniref:Lrp/AsnC family transcriptional regulator n=1 Tax=Natrialba sp. INN-245 TaxID=2690967 RepID=UPI0013130074|nr:Lrp/AsnC family transcriptional regulator [Natrialba sp. INN-245]MWV38401.1 helix-turn-helix domain-containing protein [Natrialba sp. INN-245]
MDERSVRILHAISELETDNLDEIATYTDIPKSTVHYRIDQLKEQGVITNDLYDIDIEELGLEITVITEVMAEYDTQYHKRVSKKLTAIEGVNQVYFTMGDTDLIVIAHLSDRQMVHGLIQDYEEIDEVVRTSSKFVIETVKDESYPLNDFELETLIESIVDD